MSRKKLFTKLGAIALTASMLFAMSAPAFAATTYTPVAGRTFNFSKYLIMSKDTQTPAVSFAFSIAPGTAIAAGAKNMEVLAGVGTPTVSAAAFTLGQQTKTSAGDTDIDVKRTAAERVSGATDGVQLDANEKFATSTATVDFSGVTFNEPGIYRYIITETASEANAAKGIVNDTDVDRVLDVYVTDKGDGTLEVSQYVMHTNVSDPVLGPDNGSNDATPLGDKTDGFTNEYNTIDLAVKKEVSGNQASRDKWFEFTIKLTGAADDASYTVCIADDGVADNVDGNADSQSGSTAATRESNRGKSNPTTVTGAAFKAGQKFYLQHGQSVVVRGLAPDVTYEVTEDAEDYKSTPKVVSGYTDETSGTMGTIAGDDGVVMTSYKNTRGGVIPTGVAMSIGAGLVVVGFGAAGTALFMRKRKEDDDEE